MKETMITSILERFEDALKKAGVILPDPEKETDPDAANLYGTKYGDLYDYLNEMVKEKLTDTTVPIHQECQRVFLEALTKKEVLEWLDSMCSKLEKCVIAWEDRQIIYDIYAALCDILPANAKEKFALNCQMDLRGEIRILIHATIIRKLNDFVAGVRNYLQKDYFNINYLKGYTRVMGEAIREEIEKAACEWEGEADED